MKNILVTGGAGYIGSHTCLTLLNRGFNVIVVDNLDNSKEESLFRVKSLTGKQLSFFKIDLLDYDSLETVFTTNKIDAVIHFAGLKAVGESTEIPVRYYHNNVTGTLHLLQVMQKNRCKNLVFSSSATVYGEPYKVPITEDFPLSATNPYGRSKLMIEEILMDLSASEGGWNIAILRYFNPVGAHPSGQIGEDPNGIPNNLLPFISQVACGRLPKLAIFGNDYPTHDGTGVRDYIHVVDLAEGHICALEKLEKNAGIVLYNLGTGKGYSVFDMLTAFKKISHREIPFQIVDRRAGDIAICYADPSKAEKELGWKAKLGIDDMCADTWRWQSKNPNGYV